MAYFFLPVFNIGGNIVQLSGASTLTTNTQSSITQSNTAVNTSVSSVASTNTQGSSSPQVPSMNVPQTVGVSGSNIVMASYLCLVLLVMIFLNEITFPIDGPRCWRYSTDSTHSPSECRILRGRTSLC